MSEISISEIVPAVLSGVGSALSAGFATYQLAIFARKREFGRQKRVPPGPPNWFPRFAANTTTNTQNVQPSELVGILQSAHERAKSSQDCCYGHLIATSAVLLMAFVITVLGVTVARHSGWLHFFSAAFDVCALVIAYFSFRSSRIHRSLWLRQRTTCEFVRQALALRPIFIGTNEFPGGATLVSSIESALSGRADTFDEEVSTLCGARLREIRSALEPLDFRYDALYAYYIARPQRQALWFESSLARIGRGHNWRTRLTKISFAVAAIFACVKLIALLIHFEFLVDVATALLLIAIGLSGASSSVYLGQNQRSLKHRYSQQLKAFKEWVDRSGMNGVVASLSGAPISSADVVNDIVAFEQLMMTELLDWIAISTDDSMELAPA